MTVHSSSTLLEYLLFVEGVQIPVTAVAIRVSIGQPATADFDIAPLNSGRFFSRGAKVDFFRKSSTDDQWVLKFTGILANVVYTKHASYRRLTLSAVTIDAELSHVINGCYNSATGASASHVTEIPSGGDELRNLRARQLSYRTAGGAHVYSGHSWRNIHATTAEGTVGAGKETNIADSISSALSYLGHPKPENVKTDAQYRAIVAMVGDLWQKVAVDSGGNVVLGVRSLMNDVFKRGNPNLQFQHVRFALDSMFSGLSVDAEGEVEKTITNVLKLDLSSIVTSVKDNEAGFLAVGLLGRIFSLINSSPYELSILRIVLEILRSIFYTYTVDPSRLENGIMLMPVLAPCAPPRCNVFFKEQLDNVNYNPDMWNEITRSLIYWPPVYTVDGVKAKSGNHPLINTYRFLGRMFVAPAYDPAISGLIQYVDKKTTKDISQFPVLTAEEVSSGVLTNVVRLQGDEYLVATDNTAGWAMADYIHWNTKFEHRRVTAQGALIEDVAVGFPACILDGEYTLMGILQSATYTIEASGKVNTSLELSHARYHDEFKAPYPAWLYVDDTMDENIGNAVYKPLIGTLSMTDPVTAAAAVSPDEEQSKVGLGQWAHAQYTEDAYNNSVNKADFRRQYRARVNWTLQDYLKKFNCNIDAQDSKGRPLVLAGPIFEDLIMDKDLAGSDIKPPYTSDHRRIALQYLKEYIGKVGINDE